MATCTICGKEFEAKGDWQKVCIDCYKANPPEKSKAAKAKASSGTSSASKASKVIVEPALFRKVYDEMIAEFSDIKDDVKDYLGGWVSTVVIQRSRG